MENIYFNVKDHVFKKKHAKFYLDNEPVYFCRVKKGLLIKKISVFDADGTLKYYICYKNLQQSNRHPKEIIICDNSSIIAEAYLEEAVAEEKLMNYNMYYKKMNMNINFGDLTYTLKRDNDNRFILQKENEICFETASSVLCSGRTIYNHTIIKDLYLTITFYCLIHFMIQRNTIFC